MKRNMKIKNNVDDMIYQVLNYIDHSKLPDDEAEILVFEILSTIVTWNCSFDPNNINMNDLSLQITNTCLKLNALLIDSIENNIKEYGYRVTGE